jgi:purine nucleosidase
MAMSYDEIVRLLERLDLSRRESRLPRLGWLSGRLRSPAASAAVDDLIERAMAPMNCSTSSPSALTNIASAILIEPRIIEKIVVVWLGGNAFHWPHTTPSSTWRVMCWRAEVGVWIAVCPSC